MFKRMVPACSANRRVYMYIRNIFTYLYVSDLGEKKEKKNVVNADVSGAAGGALFISKIIAHFKRPTHSTRTFSQ